MMAGIVILTIGVLDVACCFGLRLAQRKKGGGMVLGALIMCALGICLITDLLPNGVGIAIGCVGQVLFLLSLARLNRETMASHDGAHG